MPSWNAAEKQHESDLIRTATITQNTGWYKAHLVPKILAGKEKYKTVATAVGCPLVFVPLVHGREMGSDVGLFHAYLGNGQPISRKTTIVPKGRGPFATWEAGALDALRLDGIDRITDWSLEHLLYRLEGFNGYGYRSHGINSPYIWNFTNHYSHGSYTSDGHFSPAAADNNIGCFALYTLLAAADAEFKI